VPAIGKYTGKRRDKELWGNRRPQYTTDGEWCPGLTTSEKGRDPENQGHGKDEVTDGRDRLPAPKQGILAADEETRQTPLQAARPGRRDGCSGCSGCSGCGGCGGCSGCGGCGR